MQWELKWDSYCTPLKNHIAYEYSLQQRILPRFYQLNHYVSDDLIQKQKRQKHLSFYQTTISTMKHAKHATVY